MIPWICCLAASATAEVTINYQGNNIINDKYIITASIEITPDGTAVRANTGNANYPATGSIAIPISGSCSTEFSGSAFQITADPSVLDNNPESSTFGYRLSSQKSSLATEGMGVSTSTNTAPVNPAGSGTGWSSSVCEGFDFNIGTEGLNSGRSLWVTAVTLENFQANQKESVIILNHRLNKHFIALPDENGASTKTIDVRSLNILIPAGQQLADPNVTAPHGLQDFSIMVGTTPTTTGWRLKSITVDIVATIHAFNNPLEVRTGNPNVFRENGIYYFLNGNCRKASEDMIHWRALKNWMTLPPEVSAVWASHLVKIKDIYYLYFSATTPNSGPDLKEICYATGSDITGDFVYKGPVWGWKTESDSPDDADTGPDGYIDPYIFIDTDGSSYMYYTYQWANPGSAGKAKIYVAKMKSDMSGILLNTRRLCMEPSQSWENGWQEAAHVFKRNGTYYMTWSTGNFSTPWYRVGYATATNPYGPWTKAAENPILLRDYPPEGDILGPGAIEFVTSPDESEQWVMYTTHSKTNCNGPKQLCLNLVHFEANGALPDRLVIDGPDLTTNALPSGTPSIRIVTGTDSFDGTVLDSRWKNIWDEFPDQYKLGNGLLRIYPKKGDLDLKPEDSTIGYSGNIFLQYASQSERTLAKARLYIPWSAAKPVYGYILYWQDPRNYIMMKLLNNSHVKIEQRVRDNLSVYEFIPNTQNIEYLRILQKQGIGKWAFHVSANGSAWEKLTGSGINWNDDGLDNQFIPNRLLKCGLGAGVEGGINPSDTNLTVDFEFFSMERW